MLIKIEEARYLSNYNISVKFNDGRAGTIDIRLLSHEQPAAAFARLADEDFVRGFRLEYGTLCWPGDLDVAPEYVYFMAFRDDPALRDQFVSWGYLEQPAHV